MKIFCTILLVFISQQCISQVTHPIQEFSDKYYAEMDLTDTTRFFEKGSISVYDKRTNKRLIKVESDLLYYELENGKVKANVLDRPYGEQSVLIYDDFNFDGEKDFALSNGRHSCYGGPSFDVFLFNNGNFTYSSSFSKLSNEYCGMFGYDATTKRLSTYSKDGPVSYQYCEYTVENNLPKVVKLEECRSWDVYPYWSVTTEKVWKGEEVVERIVEKNIYLTEHSIETKPYYFELENGKKLLFFEYLPSKNTTKAFIRYIFIDAEGKVELEYPNPDENRKFTNFIFTENDDSYTCSFSNGNAKYTVYDYNTHERKVGINVVVNGKTYSLKGKPETAIRTLRAVKGYDNVAEK